MSVNVCTRMLATTQHIYIMTNVKMNVLPAVCTDVYQREGIKKGYNPSDSKLANIMITFLQVVSLLFVTQNRCHTDQPSVPFWFSRKYRIRIFLALHLSASWYPSLCLTTPGWLAVLDEWVNFEAAKRWASDQHVEHLSSTTMLPVYTVIDSQHNQ